MILLHTVLCTPGRPALRPNILLLVADDHSAAFVGCYGDPVIRTPHLDQLAREGMRLERAYVTSPQCVQSRASLMTGQSPVRIGMMRFGAPLPSNIVTFPELLRAAGYYTGLAGRPYHLDGAMEGRRPEETRVVFDRYHLRTFARRVDYIAMGGPTRVLQRVAAFFEQWPREKPFFLQASFYDPHRPFMPNATLQPHDPAQLRLPPFFPNTAALRADLAQYYDEVARLDGDVAHILQMLKALGVAGETLVVFIGDNGGAVLRGKGTLYELGIRVPLLIRWPGIVPPGTSTSALISSEDLAPTLLDAAGVAVPRKMSGRSFVRLLRGEAFTARSYVFAARGAHGLELPGSTDAFDLSRSVVSRTHKLIYNALWQLPYTPVGFAREAFWREIQARHQAGTLAPALSQLYFPPTRPLFELYDLRTDPYEMHNLAGTPEAAAKERTLKAALQQWMILNWDHLPLPVPP
jgi:arylsulfatase A-like enzyme